MRFSAILSSVLLAGYAAALPAPSKPDSTVLQSSSAYASSTSSADQSSYTGSSNSKSSYDSSNSSYNSKSSSDNSYDNSKDNSSYNSNSSDNSYSSSSYDNSNDNSYTSSSDNSYTSSSDDASYQTSSSYDSSATASSYDSSSTASSYDSSSTTSSYDSSYTASLDDSSSSDTSTSTASSSSSTSTYGSGYWGGSGYNDCVQQCIANYGAPSSSWSAPTSTQTASDSSSSSSSGRTWNVIVAPMQGVLRYVPSAVNASVGDTINFMWGANNHTVTKGSALELCKPNQDSAFSSGTHDKGFQFTLGVNDTDPTYFYCATPGHCSKGMFGMVNAVSAYNAPTSANQMISIAAANSSGVAAIMSYVNKLAADNNNSKALEWGSQLDLSALPDWAQAPAVENILFTRAFLAANPGVMQADGTIDPTKGTTIPKDFDTISSAAASSATSTPTASSQPPAAPTSSSSDASNSAASTPAADAQNNGAASTAASSALFGAVALAAAVLAF